MLNLIFGPPSEAFQGKHGKFYCARCRVAGTKVSATHIPLGWPRSVVFKRDFATCDEHLELSRELALAEIRSNLDTSESEADRVLSQRYGV